MIKAMFQARRFHRKRVQFKRSAWEGGTPRKRGVYSSSITSDFGSHRARANKSDMDDMCSCCGHKGIIRHPETAGDMI